MRPPMRGSYAPLLDSLHMSASGSELRLPVRLPEWMASWPVGLQPCSGVATRAGVELLLAGTHGWALVQCRVGHGGVEARTLDIDAALAERAPLVARAFTTALRRTGEPASRWLIAVADAVEAIARAEIEPCNDARPSELLALLDDRIDDADALVQLAVRAASAWVAAAVLQRLIARARLCEALDVWLRSGEAIKAEAAHAPTLHACAAMLESLSGDGLAAMHHAAQLSERAGDPATHELAGSLWMVLRRPELATLQLERRARLEPSAGAWAHVMAAAALARDAARVVEAIDCARALGHRDRATQIDAMLHAGAYAAAEQALREQLELEPESASWRIELARLLLRRRAHAEADQLTTQVPEHADAHMIRGAAAVLRGEPSNALPHLDRALALVPDHGEALLWRAEAWLRAHADDDVAAARRANEDLFAAAFDDTPVWQLLFTLVRSRIDVREGLHGPLAHFYRSLLRDVHPPSITEPAFQQDASTLALLWTTLERFGGSRSAPFSMVDAEQQLVRADELASTQVQATRWQHRLLDLPVDDVLAGFERMAARYPESPHAHTYTAEIELWRGNYEAAVRLTDEMWTRTGTRWAYIGSGAALALLGRFDEALERWELGRRRFRTYLAHEATYCHRGEVLRLLGRLDEARADLEQATRASSTRIGAWINLALVDLEAGRDDVLELALARIDELAPVLIWEASRAADRPPSTAVDRRAPKPVLEHALRLMRGNRSSVLHTFVDDRGRFRVLPDWHLDTWRATAQRLNRLPDHGLGTWLLERELAR